jgi:hypothetical protein
MQRNGQKGDKTNNGGGRQATGKNVPQLFCNFFLTWTFSKKLCGVFEL